MIDLVASIQLNKQLTYAPGPLHIGFHQATNRYRLLRAGTQAGKTIAGCQEAWWSLTDTHPYRTRLGRPTTGLVIAASHRHKVDVLHAKMWDTCPRHRLHPDSTYTQGVGWKGDRIITDTGSQVIFRVGGSEQIQLAGLTVDWIWFDELPEQSQWGEALSRIAVKQGNVWCTLTPVGRPVEWFKQIVEEVDQDKWHQTVIHLTPDNLPWRSPESLREQISNYGPDEYNQRVFAAWDGVTTDRALWAFSPTQHIIDELSEEDLTANWTVILAADHGESAGKEFVGLLLFDPKRRRLIAWDEYVSPDHTTPEQDARHIREMLSRSRLSIHNVDTAIGDTNSLGKAGAGRTVNQALGEALGLHFQKPNKAPGSVKRDTSDLNIALGRDQILVASRCVNLIKSMRHWTGKDDDLKHGIDMLRYGAQEPLRLLNNQQGFKLALGR